MLPFLDGVPCSIHGFVLPDGTAVLRPVEIASLRDPAARTLTTAGWAAPGTRRPQTARRCAAPPAAWATHLRREYGYRGAFGIDGVLTADGFRPTELNTRMSAGATSLAELDRRFFRSCRPRWSPASDPGLTAADVEALVPPMDAAASGKVDRRRRGRTTEVPHESYPVAWDGRAFARPPEETGTVPGRLRPPAGCSPSSTRAPRSCRASGWRRSTPALLRLLDASYGTAFGPLEPAPDVRTAT